MAKTKKNVNEVSEEQVKIVEFLLKELNDMDSDNLERYYKYVKDYTLEEIKEIQSYCDAKTWVDFQQYLTDFKRGL